MAGEKTTMRGDQVRRYVNTTAYWTAHASLRPKRGDVIVYEDAISRVVNGETVVQPRVKIGNGNSYLADIPFLGDFESQQLLDLIEEHIRDNVRHITAEERSDWNHKIDLSQDEVLNGTLRFTRN